MAIFEHSYNLLISNKTFFAAFKKSIFIRNFNIWKIFRTKFQFSRYLLFESLMWIRAICWKVSKLPHLGVTIFVNINDRYSSFLEIYWILYQPEQHNLNERMINGKFSGCFETKNQFEINVNFDHFSHEESFKTWANIWNNICVFTPKCALGFLVFRVQMTFQQLWWEREFFLLLYHTYTNVAAYASFSFIYVHGFERKGKRKQKSARVRGDERWSKH